MNALLRLEWLGAEAVVERLGWVLVHSLWQFALVALLAGVTVRAMRRSSSALRYGLLVTALAVSVLAPIASWILMPSDVPSDHSANRAASARGRESSVATGPGTEAIRLASKPAIAGDAEIEGPIPDRAPTSVASVLLTASPLSAGNTQRSLSWSVRAKTVLQPWLAWIVAGWSMGVVLCSARPLLGWHTLRRLKRVGVLPVSDEVLASLHLASERLGLRSSVQLLQSTLAQVPIVVGYFRPVILLPISLLTSIPAAQLEAILTHELAHIRRHDFIVNLLQTLVETLFFYHPAVWWLSRQIRVEREHCCDDLVVKLLDNRVEYGRALVAIEQLRGRNSVLALGANDGSLLSRVRRIVGFNSAGNDALAVERWPAVLLALALIAATFLLTLNWNLSAEHKTEVKGSVESLPMDPAAKISADNAAAADDDETWPLQDEILAANELEFLKPYPKLHGLSLDMNEPLFLEIVKQQKLKARKTVEGEKVTHHITLGDDHSLIVTFDKDAKCSGIQRVRHESEALKVMVADLMKLLPNDWHPQFVSDRTIEMMPGMYTDSEHRPHVVLVFTDDKTRPTMKWEREDEQYEYLGETPHGHAHLFVSMKITGAAANAELMKLFDWPEATEFVRASVKGDRAKLASLKEIADNRNWSQNGWGAIKNGMRSHWVPYSTEFIVGKPITVGLELYNFDPEPRTFSVRQAHPWRSWEVIGPDGQLVGFRPGKPITTNESFTLQTTSSMMLFGGTDLAQLFDLARPGRYTLQFNGQAVRDVPDELKLEIPANRSLPAAKDWTFQINAPRDLAADGLEFLKPYPKLYGLSLDMTEAEFLEIVKQQELKNRKTVVDEKVTYHISLGDDHTLIVMFDKDAKCSGIQRVRGEDKPRAGRGSSDPALDKTAGLPNSDEDTNSPNNANDDLRSKPAAGPGDPRPALDGKQESSNAKPALRITGRVVNAETGKVIDKIRMVPTSVYGDDTKNLTWQSQYLKDFTDGRFLYETDRPWDKTRLRIEAAGYRPAITRIVNKGEVVELEIKLERKILAGVVRLPNGQPAAKAQLALATWTNEIKVEAGQLSYSGHGAKLRQVVETDEQGRFVLPAEIDASVLVVAHAEGYAERANAETALAGTAPVGSPLTDDKPAEDTAVIELYPWGRVEGRLLLIGKPIAGAKYWVYQGRNDDVHVQTGKHIETDAEGRFAVGQLPPGRFGTCQRAADGSDGQSSFALGGLVVRFDVPAGKTITLDLGDPGRTLAGKLALPEGFPHKIDWSKVTLRVAPQTPPFNLRFRTDITDEPWAAWSKFLQSDEGKTYVRERVAITADGSFRMEGLPAAEYEISVSALGEAVADDSKPAGQILSGSQKFSVPGDASPEKIQSIDLGPINLKSLTN